MPPSNPGPRPFSDSQLVLSSHLATAAIQLATTNQIPAATQPEAPSAEPIHYKIGLAIERASNFIVPFLNDGTHIEHLNNENLALLQQRVATFYEHLDASFDTAFCAFMTMQYCASVSILNPSEQSRQDLARGLGWLDAKLVETRDCFLALRGSIRKLLMGVKPPSYPQGCNTLGQGFNPLIRIADLAQGDVLTKYGSRPPEIFAQLDDSIRDMDIFVGDIKKLCEWWQALRIDILAILQTGESSLSEHMKEVNRRSTAIRARMFPYVAQMGRTVSLGAGQNEVLEYPKSSKILRAILDNTRKWTTMSIDEPVPSSQQERQAIHWLQVQSYVFFSKTIPIHVAGREYKHLIEARIVAIERYKNEDFGLKLLIRSRNAEKPLDPKPSSDKKDEKDKEETLKTGYRCSGLTLTWSFDQRLPASGDNPVIADFQPCISITSVTGEIGHEYTLPFATLGEGFRTYDDTACRWNVAVNSSRVLDSRVSVGDCCFGVVIGLGARDRSAFTRMRLDVTACFQTTWKRKGAKLFERGRKSRGDYHEHHLSGDTALPLPLLSKLQLVPTVESSKSLLDACGLLPPHKI